MSIDFLIQLLEFIAGLANSDHRTRAGCHFFAARAFKVGVDEFGIGFPPRMIKLFTAGGTLFSINWIPLGGFVRLKGEGDPSVPGGMAAANPWVRIAVLFAGPFTNLALGAILAVFFIYSLGEPVPDKVQVQMVVPGSPAETAGLQVNDFILRVNDLSVSDVDELHEAIYANLGVPVQLTIQRGEQAILFLNRRGTATYIFCRNCGTTLKCPNCDTPINR